MSLPNFPTSKPTDSVAQPAFVPTPQPTTADPASQAADQVQAVDQTVDQVQTQTADNSQATDNGQTPNLSTQKSRILGMEIDALTMEGAIDQLWAWINDSSQTQGCRYVVTPNVDHAVLLKENKDLQAAYRDAHLILADGHPVVLASKLLGQPVPERVAGSELVPRMFDFFNHYGDLKVFLLGAAEGVAEVAAKNMLEQWPKVQTVGVYSPPMGFEKDKVECANILTRIAACKPDVVVVGLGAPKQELWVHRHHKLIDAKVALCVGATIDFLAGEKKRAPLWMRQYGLEWAHRMFSEPKRLVKRYAKDAWVFPQLVAGQWVANARTSVAQEQQELQNQEDQAQ